MEKRIADLLAKIAAQRARMDAMHAQIAKEGRTHGNEAETIEFKSIEDDIVKTKSYLKQLQDERAAIVEEETALIAARAASPAGATPPAGGSVVVTDVRDLGAEKPFRSLGEQLSAVVRAASPGAVPDERLMKLQRSATGMNESVPTEGGFLIQHDFATEILKRSFEAAQFADRCRPLPIGADKNGIKINAKDDPGDADGSRFGGIRAYWANEAEKYTASKMKLRKIEFELNKLIGLYVATEEELADAPALSSMFTEAFGDEFGWQLDRAILFGSGAGQPLGIMNSGAVVSVAKETGQAADSVVRKNVSKMRTRMTPESFANAVWLIGNGVPEQLEEMSLAVGTGGNGVYTPAGGISERPYDTLYGRPVLPTSHAKVVGDLGDIMLLDFKQYMLARKGAIQSAESMHVRFEYDERLFKFSLRVDGQPGWDKPFTPANGGANHSKSPFVTLAERA